MPVAVMHHDDLDGQCAAAIVAKAFGMTEMDTEMVFLPMNYKDEVPLDEIRDRETYIVDFSLGQQGSWDEAISASRGLVWIDHHASAIKNSPPAAHALKGLRAEGKEAGCALAWRYFFPRVPIPRGVAYISDYDTWTHEFPETRDFKAGLEAAYDTRPSSPVWYYLLGGADTFVGEVIDIGVKIRAKKVISDAMLVEAWAFDVTFNGHKGIALNRLQCGSDTFASVADRYELLLPFVFDGAQYTVSVYRGGLGASIDCSIIAEGYGGGGHPGASGFQCTKLPW